MKFYVLQLIESWWSLKQKRIRRIICYVFRGLLLPEPRRSLAALPKNVEVANLIDFA
jgi:hypothetical protein